MIRGQDYILLHIIFFFYSDGGSKSLQIMKRVNINDKSFFFVYLRIF